MFQACGGSVVEAVQALVPGLSDIHVAGEGIVTGMGEAASSLKGLCGISEAPRQEDGSDTLPLLV